jgi:hypothetical protein
MGHAFQIMFENDERYIGAVSTMNSSINSTINSTLNKTQRRIVASLAIDGSLMSKELS